MSYSPNPFTSIEERLDRIEQLLLSKPIALPTSVGTALPRHIYGINGLAKYLKCSRPTAQRIKDSGRIPFTQIGRKIVFEEKAVLAIVDARSSVKSSISSKK